MDEFESLLKLRLQDQLNLPSEIFARDLLSSYNNGEPSCGFAIGFS